MLAATGLVKVATNVVILTHGCVARQKRGSVARFCAAHRLDAPPTPPAASADAGGATGQEGSERAGQLRGEAWARQRA
jgi:hypothetical protein